MPAVAWAMRVPIEDVAVVRPGTTGTQLLSASGARSAPTPPSFHRVPAPGPWTVLSTCR